MATTTTTPETVTVGVDIGAQATKIVLGSTVGCEIVRNDVGGHATPTVVEFSNSGPGPQQRNCHRRTSRLS